MRKAVYSILAVLATLFVLGYALSHRDIPKDITYGLSFSKLHSEELGLNWKDVYYGILTELKPEHLRLSAHWPMVEPKNGVFDFADLDYQVQMAEMKGTDVILAVGRRAPGWPECHVPDWALNLSKEERDAKVLEYITAVVMRYKDAPNLKYFQVENEPYLKFAPQYCGEFDPVFLKKEVDLVHTLAPNKKVLVTDSGEMGKWHGSWQAGDVFGTSVYLYVWYNPFGSIRYPIGPWFFRIKQNVIEFLYGKKPSLLIELGLEPWLNKPIAQASRDEQLARMSPDTIEEILAFARQTGFSEQYLWGAEWWYYMKEVQNDARMWKRMQTLFESSPTAI